MCVLSLTQRAVVKYVSNTINAHPDASPCYQSPFRGCPAVHEDRFIGEWVFSRLRICLTLAGSYLELRVPSSPFCGCGLFQLSIIGPVQSASE
jgi:hypothetical protein